MSNTITNREFNRNVCRAKRAAVSGPVIITNRGKPAYVLLSYKDYARLRSEEEKEKRASQNEAALAASPL